MTPPKFHPNASAQRKLYEMLSRSGDVSFVDLYLGLGGDPARQDEVDARGRHYAQSRIGRAMTGLNRALKGTGQRVVPGRLRRTYCLTSVDE